MTKYWCLVRDPGIRLWNISSEDRLKRVLGSLGFEFFEKDWHRLPPQSSVLFVRGDYLFDERVFQTLAQNNNVMFHIHTTGRTLPVAAHVEARLAPKVAGILLEKEPWPPSAEEVQSMGLEDLAVSFSKILKKSNPPYVLPIRPHTTQTLEQLLFSGSYKGVTDLVTKFLWPRPAQWATRFCVNAGIRPNHVTALSLVLAVAAGVLFWKGQFVWGLLLGWIMTFLDTVDGKLARVTITSTWWGNIFDHGIDLIHPPLWYWAWGMGLSSFTSGLIGLSLELTIAVIFAGYVLGRLVEGIFDLGIAGFGIFLWRPFDSFFRLVTARRNPNLIFLSLSVLWGRPDVGLELVALWTAVSAVILVCRLLMAVVEKTTVGPPRSWLAEVDPVKDRDSLAVRVFTNPPAVVE